jgi:phytoene synthase
VSAGESAEEITRSSKSNLALAFVSLPKEKRRDMTGFYAFCRVVDDIADSPSSSREEKQAGLDAWKRGVEERFPGEPELAPEVRRLIGKYEIQPGYFQEIIAGVEMDLDEASYATFEDLRVYCHRVASAVGLVSIEIFGYRNPDCRQYAVDLGLALQLTNIIRDVGQDFDNGERIYLPREDMERFGYSPEDLRKKVFNANLQALLGFEAQRAIGFYESAAAVLPEEDRQSMAAAEIMSRVYRTLLARMEADGYRVLGRRYRLSKGSKLAIVGGVLLGNLLNKLKPGRVPEKAGSNAKIP